MATDHTAGVPPKRGSTILVNIGCTRNRSAALTKMAATKVASSSGARRPRGCRAALAAGAPAGKSVVSIS